MNKRLVVKQDGFKECGVACLASIIRYYGGYIPTSKLLDLTYTNKEGTNFYNLKCAAYDVGLDAQGFKIKMDDYELLNEIKLPSICQIVTDNYTHFVVIYKFKKNEVLVMDPACGFKSIKMDIFLNIWSGYILSFNKRKELPFFKEEKYLNKVIIDTVLSNKCIVLNIVLLFE